jgi:predicted phosphodiesterase
MRLGLISDVHANLHALTATIAALRRRGVDAWVQAGDLIGYGPHPNECVERVAELGTTGVAGNHELIVLGLLPGARSSERAHVSHRRTRAMLRDDVVEYLAALPRLVEVGDVVVTHGSLDDPEEYVSTAGKAAAQLNRLHREHPTARVLVLGNTHRQLLYTDAAGSQPIRAGATMEVRTPAGHVLNPGSVGQSRQWEWPPRARAAVLDTDQGTVVFETIPYDVRACHRDLSRIGLPYRSIHSPPKMRSVVSRRLHTLSARVRGGTPQVPPQQTPGSSTACGPDKGGRRRGPE